MLFRTERDLPQLLSTTTIVQIALRTYPIGLTTPWLSLVLEKTKLGDLTTLISISTHLRLTSKSMVLNSFLPFTDFSDNKTACFHWRLGISMDRWDFLCRPFHKETWWLPHSLFPPTSRYRRVHNNNKSSAKRGKFSSTCSWYGLQISRSRCNEIPAWNTFLRSKDERNFLRWDAEKRCQLLAYKRTF